MNFFTSFCLKKYLNTNANEIIFKKFINFFKIIKEI